MNQNNEKKVYLKIDFREQRSGIVEELGKLTNRLTIDICTLQTGDYLIGDKIIVERKTLSDFLNSIKNGRVFQQAYRMAQSGKNCLIILEGDKSMVESSSMSRKAVQGVLVHLEVFIGIPVIRLKDIQETAVLLNDIFHQCQQQELPRQKQIISKNFGIQISKKQRQKLFLIQNLPGIGTKKGLALLKSFRTIENIMNASPADLIKIRGIGKKLADSIFTILHEPF
jgi:DNA excision repair protein ERCC-4